MLAVFDAVAVNVSYLLALLLRFDFRFQAIPEQYNQVWENSILVHTVCSIAVYMLLKLYQSLWSYVSINEMERTLLASSVSLLIYYFLNESFLGDMPISSCLNGSNKKEVYSIEDKVDNPVSLYAVTKKFKELLAHAYSKLYNIPSTGLRLFTVDGSTGRTDMAYFGFANKLRED